MNAFLQNSIPAYLIAFFAVLLALSLPNPQRMELFFVQGSYYIMVLLVLAWVFVVVRYAVRAGATLRKFCSSHWIGLVFSLMLCVVIFVSVKPNFRVLADETNVLAVSKSMVYERKVDNIIEGKWYFLNFQPLSRVLEKRPLLFPFFAHIVHAATGYRLENVYWTNFLALFALFVLLYVWLKARVGEAWSLIVLVLVASQPIVSLCAASGGLELLQTLFLLASIVSLKHFIDQPDAARFELLWINFLMLCHTRYESFIFFAIGVGMLGYFRYLRRDYFAKSFVYSLTPLLFLPVVWQRVLMRDHFQVPEGVPVFALEHYVKYNAMFFKNLFNFGFFLPYSNILNLLGLAGVAYFIWYAFVRGRMKSAADMHFSLITLVLLYCSWVIFTSHFLGTMELPSSGRFFLMFCVAFSVSAGLLLHQFRDSWMPARVAAVAALAAFCLYHPVAVQDRFTHSQVVIREYRFVDDFLKKLKDPNILLIYGASGFFTVRDYGAVHYAHANENKDQILEEHKRRLFSDIYVVQEIEYETGKASEETKLEAAYELEPQSDLQNTAEYFLRISKVVNKR